MRCADRVFCSFSCSFTFDDQHHQWQRRGGSIIPRLSHLLTFLLVVLQSPAFVYASDQEIISYVENLIRNNTFIYSSCSTSVDGLSQTYGQNLEQLFSSLVDSVSNTGFSNTSVGLAPNTAYGLSLCLGYVPADICRNCTAVAVEKVKVDCPNNRSAMIWLAPCLLRFSDTRFFGSIGGNEKVSISRNGTKSADPTAARNFINLLIRDAANDPNMWATKIQQMDGYTSYGMAQCTRDLISSDCMLCLQNAAKQIEIENSNTEERPWRFLSASCAMGYDTRLFFLTSQVPPSPSLPLPSPSPPSSSLPLPSPSPSPSPSHPDPQKRELLDWEKRFNIIVGSARGILYLHQDSRLNIIHRDLKAGNVLLDEQMIAKISDFGMARIFSGDKDPKSTNIIVGTHGYMAPEYAIDGQFSIKSDVYSFGVLLLEIVSGLTYSGFHLSQMGCSLIGYAWNLWRSRRMSDFIDPVLGESASTSQILKCFHIGLLCVQEDPASRPTMSAIINMLESDSAILPTPQQPPLVFSSSISNSSNSMTGKNGSSKSASTNSESSSRLKHSLR